MKKILSKIINKIKKHNYVEFVIRNEFSILCGPGYYREGSYSGEELREECLIPILENLKNNEKLLIDLDGTNGYGVSFLETAFGDLVNYNGINYLDKIEFISNEEPHLIETIKQFAQEKQNKIKNAKRDFWEMSLDELVDELENCHNALSNCENINEKNIIARGTDRFCVSYNNHNDIKDTLLLTILCEVIDEEVGDWRETVKEKLHIEQKELLGALNGAKDISIVDAPRQLNKNQKSLTDFQNITSNKLRVIDDLIYFSLEHKTEIRHRQIIKFLLDILKEKADILKDKTKKKLNERYAKILKEINVKYVYSNCYQKLSEKFINRDKK